MDWVVNYDFTRQFTLMRNMNRGSRKATTETRDYLRQQYQALAARLKLAHGRLKSHPATLPVMIGVLAAGLLLVLGSGRLLAFWRRSAAQVRSRAGRATLRDATVAYQFLLDLCWPAAATARRPACRPASFSPPSGIPYCRLWSQNLPWLTRARGLAGRSIWCLTFTACWDEFNTGARG